MSNQQLESLRTTKTNQLPQGVRFDRLVFGGLLAVLPALMAAKGCDVAEIGSDDRACGGLEGLSCESGEFCEYAEDDSCGAADATGVCVTKPEACTLEYSPVCGCDGATYGNACSAAAEGVSVASEGECGEPSTACGGLTGEACDEGEFCNYPISAMCGAADATGVCEPIAEVCPAIYAPVCGCNDKTYGNECEANSEGVSVASEGECGEPSTACGGLTGEACEEGEFCNYPISAMCGAADATGVCEPKLEACDGNYDPVCGCDGETYGNECEANSEGVSVASEGECGEPSNVCGGLIGSACEGGEFCNYPISAMCGAADATGVCEPIPKACEDVYEPVCGCDDETYGNACYAGLEGVSVAGEGECGEPSDVCGGLMGAACDEGEFCNYPLDAMCGAADATGVCEPMPEACIALYDPVCGCDDETYGNACEAHAAGVSVVHAGECDGEGKVCGGLSGGFCDESEFCNIPIQNQCGIADGPGVCEPMPDVCTAQYDPVCGCDGETYGNECEARAAGQSVQALGECTD